MVALLANSRKLLYVDLIQFRRRSMSRTFMIAAVN
jgi:hypothetical protein